MAVTREMVYHFYLVVLVPILQCTTTYDLRENVYMCRLGIRSGADDGPPANKFTQILPVKLHICLVTNSVELDLDLCAIFPLSSVDLYQIKIVDRQVWLTICTYGCTCTT